MREALLSYFPPLIRHSVVFTLLAVFTAPLSFAQSQIYNEIVGEPTVRCEDTAIVFTVRTQDTFRGNIFVRSHFSDPSCRVDAHNNDYAGATITVSLIGCGVSRVRQIQPPGMNYLTVIEVSFHPLVITKRDRAYNVRCFYAHIDQTVKNGLSVSPLPTLGVEQATIVRPQCVYSIRLGSLDGPIATTANVGDMTYHRWECDNANYGMVVKNCYVNSGAMDGITIQVIDQRGCPISSSMLQAPLNYSPSGTLVWAEIDAYKFPDQMKVVFSCEIAVCAKVDNQCVGLTPPTCTTVGRSSVYRSMKPTPSPIPAKVVSVGVPPRFTSFVPPRFVSSPPIDTDDDLVHTMNAVVATDLPHRFIFREGSPVSTYLRPFQERVLRQNGEFAKDEEVTTTTIDERITTDEHLSVEPEMEHTTTEEEETTTVEFARVVLNDGSDETVEESEETSSSSPALPSTSLFSLFYMSPSTSPSPVPSSLSTTSTLPPTTTFDPLDFTIPQARYEGGLEQNLVAGRTLMEMLPAYRRLIRTPPPTFVPETTPAIVSRKEAKVRLEESNIKKDVDKDGKQFDDIFKVTAEMVVEQRDTEINGTGDTPNLSSSPLHFGCLDSPHSVLILVIFAFLILLSLLSLAFALCHCNRTFRRRVVFDTSPTSSPSPSCSPREIPSFYHPLYGNRSLGSTTRGYI